MTRESELMDMFVAMKNYFGEQQALEKNSLFSSLASEKYSPFIKIIGLILTHQFSSNKVIPVLDVLSQQGWDTPAKLFTIPQELLSSIIAPCSNSVAKAKQIKAFLDHLLLSCPEGLPPDGSLSFLEGHTTEELYNGLLSIRGIGQERAEMILLFAMNRNIFVTGLATFRILYRHGMVSEDILHDELRDFFMDVLPVDRKLYKEFYELLRKTSVAFCKAATPVCANCPLLPMLTYPPE